VGEAQTPHSKTRLQTIVFICQDRGVPDEQLGISITLSPAQVDEIVRAASDSRAPSLAAQIADSLHAKPPPTGYLPSEQADQRLSRSLLRGLSILTGFGPDGAPRGIVELAGELGMSPSTAHRYALTLVELGLLERCPTTRKYRLPPAPAG
jgi:hypothetical protein